MKTVIEIEIKDIQVNSVSKYFCFSWSALVNGKKKEGSYDSSYSGQSASAIRGKLKRGYAVELAIIDLFGF